MKQGRLLNPSYCEPMPCFRAAIETATGTSKLMRTGAGTNPISAPLFPDPRVRSATVSWLVGSFCCLSPTFSCRSGAYLSGYVNVGLFAPRDVSRTFLVACRLPLPPSRPSCYFPTIAPTTTTGCSHQRRWVPTTDAWRSRHFRRLRFRVHRVYATLIFEGSVGRVSFVCDTSWSRQVKVNEDLRSRRTRRLLFRTVTAHKGSALCRP